MQDGVPSMEDVNVCPKVIPSVAPVCNHTLQVIELQIPRMERA